jgi:hypothetical protein
MIRGVLCLRVRSIGEAAGLRVAALNAYQNAQQPRPLIQTHLTMSR